MTLNGDDPQDLKGIQSCLKKFYDEYIKLRITTLPTEFQEINYKHLLTLLQAYCGILKANPAVCDYWVQISYKEQTLDSRELRA